MKRIEAALFVNGKPTRGIIEQLEISDIIKTHDSNSYWDSNSASQIIASGDSNTHIMIPGTLGITGNTWVKGTLETQDLVLGTTTAGGKVRPAVPGEEIIFTNADHGSADWLTLSQDELGFLINGQPNLTINATSFVVNATNTDQDFAVMTDDSNFSIENDSEFDLLALAANGGTSIGGGTSRWPTINGMRTSTAIKTLQVNGITTIYSGGTTNPLSPTALEVVGDVQVKSNLGVTGHTVITGTIGIGTTTPKTKLDVHHNPTNLADSTGGGEVVTFGTASGALTAGKLYYLNTSGVWTLTRSNASSSNGNSQLLGIALGTAVSNGILLRGFFDMTTYLTGTFNEGISLYVCETTAGNINIAAPGAANEFIRVVGYATSTANVIYFNPDGTYITLS